MWPARTLVRGLLAVEAAFSISAFVVFAAVLLLAEGRDPEVRRPFDFVALIAFFVIVLVTLATRRSIRAKRLAAGAAPLPDHALRQIAPAVDRGRTCAISMCLYSVLLAIRFFLPSALEPLTLLTVAGIVLCATVGPAAGTVVAVRRYERTRGRTLFVADAAGRGPMYWEAGLIPSES